MTKPYSPSCERNREPILSVLREHFADRQRVLEIGSGTGQHAVFFAAAMPWLVWQCSDRAEYLPGIRMWLAEAGLANTPAVVELDVASGPWSFGNVDDSRPPTPARPASRHSRLSLRDARGSASQAHRYAPRKGGGSRSTFDAAFSANTLHIMGWAEVEAFFAGLDTVLGDDATLVVYGPFNYGGAYTSDSNREFDGWLQARDPHSGIRDFEAVAALARTIGLSLAADVPMPANNRCLVWRRD